MPTTPWVITALVATIVAVAATRQAARRKGRSLAWGFASIYFPPALLVLELLPNRPTTSTTSNLVLEWVGALAAVLNVVLIMLVVAAQ